MELNERDKKIIEKIEYFGKKYCFSVLLFAVMIRLFHISELQVSDYEMGAYLLNYSDGFGTRLLVGSLIQKLNGGMVTHDFIIKANSVVLVCNCMLFCLMTGFLYNKCNAYLKKVIIYLILLLLSLPSISIWIGKYIGRLDVYLLFFALLSIFILHTKLPDGFKYFLVIVLSVVALLIHQVYVLTYFIPVYIDIVYQLNNKKENMVSLIKSVFLILFPIIVFFFYLMFFTGFHFSSIDEIMNICSVRTQESFSEGMFYNEYIMSVKENLIDVGLCQFPDLALTTLLNMIMVIPFWLFVGWFGYNIFKLDNKAERHVHMLQYSSYFLYIILFLTTVDHGRWMTVLINSLIGTILIGINNGDKRIIQIFDYIRQFVEKHYYIILLVIAYLFTINCYDIFL
ncbi:MAG: hypothetical protein ACI4GW_04460 [Lachnospiraceae bacterium]